MKSCWKHLKCGRGRGCWKSVGLRRWQMKRCWYMPMKLGAYWKWCRKHRWLGHVLRHDSDIIEGKMLDKATCGRKRMELLHDMMEGRDYGHVKDLISDRSRWRQDSKWECMSETCWKQQTTKEEEEHCCVCTLVKRQSSMLFLAVSVCVCVCVCLCVCVSACQYLCAYVCVFVSAQ